MKILAVDDDPFIRELFPAIFEKVELTDIQTAESGAAALALLEDQDQSFDCLLLDVDMPGMNGIELCRRIRALPSYADKPILMLTAKTNSQSIENAFAAGANDYISKPFNLKDISNRIRVAERLLDSAKRVQRVDPQGLPSQATRGQHDFNLEDKLTFANVDRLIMSFSLGNYLAQLDRADLSNHQVFCVTLAPAETLFEHSTTQEFVTVLADLAEAICETVTCEHMLMSYEGSGMFQCITRDPDLPGWEQLEVMLQKNMDDIGHTLALHCPTPIAVCVGAPVAPFANRTQRVKKTFDRSMARAQMRCASKMAAA